MLSVKYYIIEHAKHDFPIVMHRIYFWRIPLTRWKLLADLLCDRSQPENYLKKVLTDAILSSVNDYYDSVLN